MPDIRQFKAARALLDWTQDDLAKASGVALPTIANIERGSSKPRSDTIAQIQKAFEDNGVEFIDPAGVQLVSEKFALRVWNGREAQFKLWNDIYKEFGDGNGGEILLNNVSDLPLVERYPAEALQYTQRLDALRIKRRILICEGDDHVIGDARWYRQVPPVLFGQNAYYVYKDKVALLIWSIPRILVIQNKNIADMFRTQFDYNWSLAAPVANPIHLLQGK